MYFESVAAPRVHPVGSPGAPTVTRIKLGTGDVGVEQTARIMVEQIRQGAFDPAVKEIAVDVTDGAGPVDRQEFARRILYHVRGTFRYVPDTRDVEELWSPSIHARRYRERGHTWGDCDDLAMWIGALARSVGCHVRVHAIANGKRGKELNHVFTEVEVEPGLWRKMDFLSPNSPVLAEKIWYV